MRRSTLSILPGPRQASADPFLNHCPFELGENPHHLEHGLAAWRRRVEPLLMQVEIDLERVDFRQEDNEVLQRTTETIDRPCHDDIEFSSRGIAAQPIERWPGVAALGAADAVILVNLDDLAAYALDDLPQLTLLIGRRLVEGTHS
jgi:hypothetical protein